MPTPTADQKEWVEKALTEVMRQITRPAQYGDLYSDLDIPFSRFPTRCRVLHFIIRDDRIDSSRWTGRK